jgi:hypothetical protein
MDFLKYQISAQNQKVLTFNFTEKRQFDAKTERKSVFLGHEVHEVFGFIEKRQLGTKIDRNSIFLGRETHIPDQLYIMVLLISFLWIKKNQISVQNQKVLAFIFTEKC